MAATLKDGRVHVADANGTPYSGAKMFVYDAGTVDLQNIWTDSGLSVGASNPLISDSSGYFALTFLTAGTYKLVITEADDTAIITLDNQDTGIPLGSGVLAIANGGTAGATAAAARTALDVPANSEITTISSDILARLKKTGGTLTGDTDNSGTGFFSVPSGTTAQRATPSSGTGVRFNSTTSRLEAYLAGAWTELLGAPRGYIDGLIMSNNSGDQDKLDISPGICRSDDDTTNMRLTSTMVKQLDASWAEGSPAGGIDGSTIQTNTWYHVFVIHDADSGTTDVLFSTSFASPTLPTGGVNYTKKRRIGSVLTNGSPDITLFLQSGDTIWWDVGVADLSNGSIATGGTALALTVPPGLSTEAIFNASTGTATMALYFYSPDTTGAQPSVTAPPVGHTSISAGDDASGFVRCLTNTSKQVTGRASGSATDASITTLGWVDPRGRDA